MERLRFEEGGAEGSELPAARAHEAFDARHGALRHHVGWPELGATPEDVALRLPEGPFGAAESRCEPTTHLEPGAATYSKASGGGEKALDLCGAAESHGEPSGDGAVALVSLIAKQWGSDP